MDTNLDSQITELHVAATSQLPANFHVLNHPLLLHKLSIIRSEGCSTDKYHRVIREISSLIAYEITHDLKLSTSPVVTCEIPQVPDYKPSLCLLPSLLSSSLTVVAVLRAGLTMAEGFLELLPSCRTGHIGIHRDERTNKLVDYVVALPQTSEGFYYIVDPIIATGETAAKCLDIVSYSPTSERTVKYVSIVSSLKAATKLCSSYPSVDFYCVAIDADLVDGRYLSPGIGDAANRLFGVL